MQTHKRLLGTCSVQGAVPGIRGHYAKRLERQIILLEEGAIRQW